MSDDLPKYILGIASLIIIIFVAITKFFPQSQSAVEKTTLISRNEASIQRNPQGNILTKESWESIEPANSFASNFPFNQSHNTLRPYDTAPSFSIYDFTTKRNSQGGSNKEKYKKLKNITKISS